MAKKKTGSDSDYALASNAASQRVAAPALDYRPPVPEDYRPRIGLIGCGGITSFHLEAYRRLRFPVVAMQDLDRDRAVARRDQYFPRADVHADHAQLLARDDVEIVDVATHPQPREQILADAIRAGKHALSQKPFVVDLGVGRKLVNAAKRRGVCLAVNQNGRWAPHFSYLRHAVEAGVIGDLVSIDIAIHWDHNWVHGTPFDRVPQLLLYDFAVHWFDMLRCLTPGRRPLEVQARLFKGRHQTARPPLQASVQVLYRDLLATLVFRGSTPNGAYDKTVVVGTEGTLVSEGPDLNHQKVRLVTSRGIASPRLRGTWFTSGFEGTMGELACAVDQQREPYHSARHNLPSLALAFAAIASADRGQAVRVGTVERLRPEWITG